MNIVFSCDNNYSPYLTVNIISILKYNQNIHFYVLDLGISDENKSFLISLVETQNSQISFISVNQSEFNRFPQTISHISIATYARLKLADYLPKNIKKVIYLDVDTLTINSLEYLWHIDLENKTIGAVFDSYIDSLSENYKEKIGLPPNTPYFNAGVLLIDMEKFREYNVYQKSISYLNDYPNIKYQDQDILNFIFKDLTKFINPRFNFMPFLRNRIKSKLTNPQYENLISPICIVHYCGDKKPWHKKCSHIQANTFIKTYDSIKNKPIAWDKHIEKINLFTKLSRIQKEIKNNILYGIK